jgi:hypothetical protein
VFAVRPGAPLVASDWADRLRRAQEVHDVQPVEGSHPCTAARFSLTPPAADEDDGLPPDQVGAYTRLDFAAGVSYAMALDETTNLGLRLADPCYERAVGRGQSPAWDPVGQDATFASGQTFIVATTALASTRWRERAQARAGSGATGDGDAHAECRGSMRQMTGVARRAGNNDRRTTRRSDRLAARASESTPPAR